MNVEGDLAFVHSPLLGVHAVVIVSVQLQVFSLTQIPSCDLVLGHLSLVSALQHLAYPVHGEHPSLFAVEGVGPNGCGEMDLEVLLRPLAHLIRRPQ